MERELSFGRACSRVALSLLFAASFAYAAPTKSWTVVDLTPDSAAGGLARDVNNRGDVVGHTFTQTGPLPFGFTPHAFVWRAGTREDIGSAVGRSSVARGVNDEGTIVGTVDGKAYQWKDGQGTSLQVAGNAVAVNNAGDIVGDYWTGGSIGSGQDKPYVMRNGVLFELPGLGAASGDSASDINNEGDIAGWANVGNTSNTHAALWQDLAITDLGTLGGLKSFGTQINDAGVIVGRAQAANGAYYMARWHVSGGPLENLMEGGAPTGINNRGAIVGSNMYSGIPFLYEDGQVTNLLDLPAMKSGGWTAFSPMSINDRGWIVGSAFRPGGPFWGTALLLIPR